MAGGATVQCPTCGAFERVGTARCFSCGTGLTEGDDAPDAAGFAAPEGQGFGAPPPIEGPAYGHPSPGTGPYPPPYGAADAAAPYGAPPYGGQPYGGQAYGYGYPGYVQPKHDKDATKALVVAIISFFICGVILAPAAIIEGNKSKKKIRESNGMLSGDGMAQAAMVLGIVSLALNVIGLIFYIWASTKTSTRYRY
jgi:hypothetical protein